MASPTFSRTFLWALAGTVAAGLAGWGLLVLLAKLGSPGMVGQYALGMALVTPLALMADLHLRAVLATDVRGQFPFCDYLGLRLAGALLVLAVVAAVVPVLGHPKDTSLVIVAVAAARGLDSLSDLLHGLFQQRERMDLMAVAQLLRGTLPLGLAGLAVYATGTVLAAVLALIARGCSVCWLTSCPGPGWCRARPPRPATRCNGACADDGIRMC